MTIEQEVSTKVYKMMELHQNFSEGLFEEMNSFYSDDFQGLLYMPWVGELERYDVEGIKEGNRLAAEYYKDKDIQFIYTGLKIVPQSANEAAVSYEVIHQNKEQHILVRALSLEVWRKEMDGNWRMIRWYEEKGMRT
ncbi:hypothetical protein CFK37_17900 [Virgibacillus phasianinus]|uniref:DUF4440 domain-containing protein n=1 Tax=Virgibacillus phasianinus TaxID=2017483 RepID=A0A220U6X1_9BACI|nr:hypothetical protein [Virgibacillus phasianinus]ASK63898.1 hypothetical protein CFK37_17900 [Virgibacillus phasianinus]